MISLSKLRTASVAVLVLAIISIASLDSPAQSWKRIIIKASSDDFQRIQNEVGVAVLDAIPGYYLVNAAPTVDAARIERVQGKGPIAASENSPLSIPRRVLRATATAVTYRPPLGAAVNWFGTPARQVYTDQPAVSAIRLKDALHLATGQGARVAVIDTGVDERHPTLRPALLPGKNYVGSTTAASEWDDPVVAQSTAVILDQSTAAILDQSTAVILDQSTAAILDQSTAAILDHLPAFGHGTMMSGLIHLVAPNARIIPLKAFDASGASSEWNIVRAIYDAVNMGADIINMSFSAAKNSKMIQSAVDFAASRGVVMVVATGNDNTESPTYPASLDPSVGVSSLDVNDQKAPFSNYGKYVDLSAPGTNLVTTYPGGRFAMSSGTSDSVALVSGVFALVNQRNLRGNALRQKVEAAVDLIQVLPQYRNKLGRGRINALKAVN